MATNKYLNCLRSLLKLNCTIYSHESFLLILPPAQQQAVTAASWIPVTALQWSRVLMSLSLDIRHVTTRVNVIAVQGCMFVNEFLSSYLSSLLEFSILNTPMIGVNEMQDPHLYVPCHAGKLTSKISNQWMEHDSEDISG